MGESFIVDHARRSVLPERLTDIILGEKGLSEIASTTNSRTSPTR